MVVGTRHQEPLKRLYRGPSLFLTRFGPLWRPRGYLWRLPLDWGYYGFSTYSVGGIPVSDNPR